MPSVDPKNTLNLTLEITPGAGKAMVRGAGTVVTTRKCPDAARERGVLVLNLRVTRQVDDHNFEVAVEGTSVEAPKEVLV